MAALEAKMGASVSFCAASQFQRPLSLTTIRGRREAENVSVIDQRVTRIGDVTPFSGLADYVTSVQRCRQSGTEPDAIGRSDCPVAWAE